MDIGPTEIKSRLSSISLNTNTVFEDEDADWYSENSEGGFDDFQEEEDEYEQVTETNINGDEESSAEEEEDEEDFEEVNSATFIMNQKSLADKAPGALQHSFAHRTIPLPYSFHIRLFQFISVFVICFMTAGIPFGLPALRQLLVEEGIYGVASGEEDAKQSLKRVGCSIQEGRLAVLQGSGWISWMIGGWLAARCVQHMGPRNTAIIGCGSIMVGSFLLAVSMPSNNHFLLPSWARMYILPVMIMSVGSSFSFLACLHYVRLFPKRTSLLHSVIFLAQDLSAFMFHIMYESRGFISLRNSLFIYAGSMLGQVIFWKFVFSSGKVPTIRFTVTTWHQRPLLVDKSLPEHIASPYFYLALLFTATVFLKLYFYMSTFQVQLRVLLLPTKRHVNPVDFTYRYNEHLDEGKETGGDVQQIMSKFTSAYDINPNKPVQFFSHVPFFAEQPGGNSSNNVRLRQFIYNPMQPEIFLTDIQEMLYLLIPIAPLITIFWMRTSMSDRKISTSLLFTLLSLVTWGFVQNVFSVKFQAFAAMIFPIFRSLFISGIYDYCERIFGCQHFHFTFWFLWAVAGLIIGLVLLPLSYFSINLFVNYTGLFERINGTLNVLLLIIGLFFIWILKCNKL